MTITEAQSNYQPRRWHQFSLYLYPALLLLITYGAWGIALQTLGFEPRPYQDDPSFMSQPIKTLHLVGIALFFLSPFATYGAFKLTTQLLKTSAYSKVILPILIWIGGITLLIVDPWQTFKWFID